MKFSNVAFAEILDRHPSVSRALLRTLGGRIRGLGEGGAKLSEPYQPSEASRVRGGLLSEALAAYGREGRSFQHLDRGLFVEVLRNVPLFARLGKRDLRRVADAAQVTRFAAQEHVVRKGFSAEGFFVVLTGRAVVRRTGADDRQLARGEWFGELGLLDGAPRTASVVTETEAWLMKLARANFLALLDHHASIGRGVAEGLAARLRTLIEQGSEP